MSSVVYVVALLVIFGDLVASTGSGCFCDYGCYTDGFQTLCCDGLCKDAEERKSAADCKKKCPVYQEKADLVAKVSRTQTLI